MSHLVGYHRVSSAAQDLELGRAALVKAGVPENRIYAEKVSGKSKDNRPELKAMLKACKVLAFNAIDVMNDPSLLEPVRKEFAESVKAFDYEPPVGPEVKPGLPSHMRE